MSIHTRIEAANDRLTYAEAAMIVAAERGPRPIVRVPIRTSYSGLSNEARYLEATRMFDGITAREEWDRAVKRVLANPVAASVDHMHAIAAGERRSAVAPPGTQRRRIEMSPDRQAVINGKTIKEYYWAGEMVVYIDNRLSGMTFDMACERERAAIARATGAGA